MYASYEFYSQEFGGKMPETDYPTAEAKAEAFIRYLTYPNGDIFATENRNVKIAVCAAVETMYDEALRPRNIKSESNDGYSVTYVTESQDGQTAESVLSKKLAEVVRLYLLPTGWLNRSVKSKC